MAIREGFVIVNRGRTSEDLVLQYSDADVRCNQCSQEVVGYFHNRYRMEENKEVIERCVPCDSSRERFIFNKALFTSPICPNCGHRFTIIWMNPADEVATPCTKCQTLCLPKS